MAYKRGQPLINFSPLFQAATHIVFRIVDAIAFLVIFAVYQTSFEGRMKLQRFKGSAVLVSNHTTFLDPVAVGAIVLPRTTYHTLLEATVTAPVLGTFIRLLGGVPLPPGVRGLEKMIDCAEKAFKVKHFIHFYPEGECSLYNQIIEPFRFGSFYLATRLDVPVIPIVTVLSEGRRKPGTRFARKFPKQRLVVLEPFYPKDFARRNEKGEIDMESMNEFAEAVRQRMQQEIDKRHAADSRAGTQSYYKGKMARIKGLND